MASSQCCKVEDKQGLCTLGEVTVLNGRSSKCSWPADMRSVHPDAVLWLKIQGELPLPSWPLRLSLVSVVFSLLRSVFHPLHALYAPRGWPSWMRRWFPVLCLLGPHLCPKTHSWENGSERTGAGLVNPQFLFSPAHSGNTVSPTKVTASERQPLCVATVLWFQKLPLPFLSMLKRCLKFSFLDNWLIDHWDIAHLSRVRVGKYFKDKFL